MKGERGKRGKRGHCGKPGLPGASMKGPTGATGPCCTGPTGPAESSAFVYTANTIHGQPGPGQSVPSDPGNSFPNPGDVKFILPGTTNVLGIIPDLAQTGFQAVTAGTYHYGFQVRGFSEGDQFPLDFEIRVNGLFSGSQNKFKSEIPNLVNEILTVSGNGLIHLNVNDVVSLRNVGAPVSFSSNDSGAPPPNQLSVDASLSLVLVHAD